MAKKYNTVKTFKPVNAAVQRATLRAIDRCDFYTPAAEREIDARLGLGTHSLSADEISSEELLDADTVVSIMDISGPSRAELAEMEKVG